MNIFINISHPAHVHFFKNLIWKLESRGHEIIIGARGKEFTEDLLKAYGINYILLTNKGIKLKGLIKELIIQQVKISKILRSNHIDLMLQIGGIFNAPIGKYYNIPTLAFSDTENDKWGNKVSFGLSKYVLSPSCFDHNFGGSWKNQITYPGYHELAYLSPEYAPIPINYCDKILVRFVGWGAGHDIGEKSISNFQKIELINILNKYGSVYISSEMDLPFEINQFKFQIHPSKIHNFMKDCKLVIGESATMCSEAACLGIPAVFISNTGRGYTTEQDNRYGLVRHFQVKQWNDMLELTKNWLNRNLKAEWQEKRFRMLKEKIEVTSWMENLVENYPRSIYDAQKGNFEEYRIKCAG